MIIVIITLVSIASFILTFILDDKISSDFPMGASMVASICGVLVTVLILCSQYLGVERELQHNQIEYETLMKRMEVVNSDYEDVSKSDVIKDIGEWNKNVYDEKYWAENPWTNWLWNKKVSDSLEYIELE